MSVRAANDFRSQRRLPVCALWLLASASAAAGCGGDPYQVGDLVPVEGQVQMVGQPLRLGESTFGRVWFHPDTSKGNACPQVPTADLDANGTYRLSTRGRPGAPPGWYKVMVVVTEQIDPTRPSRRRKSFVHLRYGAVETSGLAVCVSATPAQGAYDLRLRK